MSKINTTSLALFYSSIIDFGSNYLENDLRDQYTDMVNEAYDEAKKVNKAEIARAFDIAKIKRTGKDYYKETYER
jgi:hypothetical protein